MLISRVFVDLFRDLRYGARLLGRSKIFTVIATLSLALGIGGAAAVFTLINAVMIRTLPVAEPSQLFVATKRLGAVSSPRYSWIGFQEARDAVKGRAEVAATTNALGMQVVVPATGQPRLRRAARRPRRVERPPRPRPLPSAATSRSSPASTSTCCASSRRPAGC